MDPVSASESIEVLQEYDPIAKSWSIFLLALIVARHFQTSFALVASGLCIAT